MPVEAHRLPRHRTHGPRATEVGGEERPTRGGAALDGAPGEGEWLQVGGGKVRHQRQRFTLRTTGKAYRYYLVWITKLPPGAERVEISDVSLFRKAA